MARTTKTTSAGRHRHRRAVGPVQPAMTSAAALRGTSPGCDHARTLRQTHEPLPARRRASPSRRRSRPLEGEDITTTRWEDARHWMSIYSDLLEFKRGILGRTERDLPGLHPTAQKAAAVDLQIIETQMHGYPRSVST